MYMNCLTLILFMKHAITKCILNTEIILSIIALCLMLLGAHYAQNYAGIIGWCLITSFEILFISLYRISKQNSLGSNSRYMASHIW